jgi:hypothetical protein
MFGFGGRTAMVLLGVILLWAGPALAVTADNTIIGTVSLPAGVTTGRVYLKVMISGGGETSFGKSVAVNPAGATTYTIRGPGDGSYVVAGFLDELDRRVPFTSAALGQSGPVTITGNVASGPADLTIAYPQSTPTATLQGLDIMTGDTKLLVFAISQRDNLGFLNADQVSICYDTDQNFGNPTCPTNLQNIPVTGPEVNTVVGGLQNDTTYYFRATPSLNLVEGTPTTGSGTPTAPGAGSTVSGTANLNFTGTPPPAGTKVWIVILNDQIPGAQQPSVTLDYFLLNQDGVSADFSLPGVPDGPFVIYALADLNANDIIDMGEPSNTDNNSAPLITVAGQNLTGQSVTLTDAPMSTRVTTQHQRRKGVHTYGINFDFSDGSKRPVNIALTGINQVAFPIPMDLGLTQWGSFYMSLFDLGFRPQPTDTFDSSVRYLGDLTGGIPYSVIADTVLDTFAAPTAPNGYLLNDLQPDFSWSNPASPPPYYANYFKLESIMNQMATQLYPSSYDIRNNLLAGGTTSLAYPLVGDLSYDQLYQWSISVIDLNGNQAEEITEFTPVTQLPGLTRPALFRAGTWFLDINNSHSWDAGDLTFKLGTTGDIPVPADWNHDGNIETGVFRAGTWLIDLNGNGIWDAGDQSFKFGKAGDIPVPADWNNDGFIEPGLFRAGYWYIDSNNNHIWNDGDVSFKFGTTGDIPVPAAWNGSTNPVVAGLFRAGTWLIDSNNNHIWNGGDVSFKFGKAGDFPVPADWNNDGNIAPGLFRSGYWYIDSNNNHIWNDGDTSFKFGTTGDLPGTFR